MLRVHMLRVHASCSYHETSALLCVLSLLTISHTYLLGSADMPLPNSVYGIPRMVWQTYPTHTLPPAYARERNQNIALNPMWTFNLWNDSEIGIFIAEQFHPEVGKAFGSLHPALGALRADFWRYCILYVYGGVYLDIDSTFRIPLDLWINISGPTILSFDPT